MTNSEARKRTHTARPCPTCSGPSRETVGMICQTCGTDYAPHPAMAAAVAAFSAEWEAAHERGWSGHRVEAGLRALLAAGWRPPTDDSAWEPPAEVEPVPTLRTITDLLSLVADEYPGDAVTEDEVDSWSSDERVAAITWAAAVHLRASDHDDVVIPDLPDVLARRAGGASC